jgi:uncharacterized protein (DUF4415 family)
VYNRAYSHQAELVRDERQAAANCEDQGIELAECAIALHSAAAERIMKRESDVPKGRRSATLGAMTGKTRITIRIDDDVLAWFRARAREAGGASYQTLVNRALRAHVEASSEPLEATLRRVLHEEFERRRKSE